MNLIIKKLTADTKQKVKAALNKVTAADGQLVDAIRAAFTRQPEGFTQYLRTVEKPKKSPVLAPLDRFYFEIAHQMGWAEWDMEAAKQMHTVDQLLEEREKHILYLRCWNGYSYQEISDSTGICPAMVFRIVRRIKQKIGADYTL